MKLEPGEIICDNCVSKIKQAELCCPVCNKVNFTGNFCSKHQRGFYFEKLLFVSRFKSLNKKIVHSFKYEGVRELSKFMADLMTQALSEKIKDKNEIILVPVPLFFIKRLSRGFNQSEMLAQKISQNLNIPTQKLLLKTRATKSQTEFKKNERHQNIKDAFCLSELGKKETLKSKIIILVDDVYTTGSTINEAAKVLKNNPLVGGPKEIWALTFCKD